ncbi:hypothetical protein BK133_05280 [Paenibacillus sp. FSL H8-0548]|uniref:hypothetical protein n=1 Tax=Paenibacillus sp. FSL H8-0548 TaxID=1920422 RepID=UPI00096DE0DD|nr:hypothetical protein [Paenibacillus sp. FSL H8-0548]OMF37470.1 hypothetical protein BK133_05280 [Paenibacillus sp. FSL H8-0548]
MPDNNNDFIDEVAASSDTHLPISAGRAAELNRLVNDIWSHAIMRYNCSSIELKLVANQFKTFAENLEIT